MRQCHLNNIHFYYYYYYLANKYEDIVNLQGEEAYCVATRTACCEQDSASIGTSEVSLMIT